MSILNLIIFIKFLSTNIITIFTQNFVIVLKLQIHWEGTNYESD